MRMIFKKKRRYFLLVFVIVTLLVGIWLTLSPQMERQRALAEQERLLGSITAGNGTITLDPKVVQSVPDDYDVESAANSNVSTADVEVFLPIGDVTNPQETDIDTLEITGIGILRIGKIDLELPVVDGVTKSKLKVAIGRVPRTAAIGEIGNAVIAGHRSYTYGKYFNRLGEIVVGDMIEYQAKDGGMMHFEVYQIRTIMPGDQSAFRQPKDSAEITLYTCTPIRVANRRLLIHAKLIEEVAK